MNKEVKTTLLQLGRPDVNIGSPPDLICVYRADQQGAQVLIISEASLLFFVPDESIQKLLDVCDAAGLSVRVT